jgi:nucleoside 2-deoxyribosyltransferase
MFLPNKTTAGPLRHIKRQRLYITGPQYYYAGGFEELKMMKAAAEYYGFEAINDFAAGEGRFPSCPPPPGRDHLDICDIVVADVSFFRGGEPESAVIFDLGIGFAKKKKLYTFTGDRRDVIHRYREASYNEQEDLRDNNGWPFTEALSMGNLMYAIPSKVVEGNFEDCLKVITLDLIEEAKDQGQRIIPRQDKRNTVTWDPFGVRRAYLAGFECFMPNARETGDRMKEICRNYGFQGIFPGDTAPGVPVPEETTPMNHFAFRANIFDRDQQHIRNSNFIIANLNPFHGEESDSGTAFEAGMCYGLGYDCYGFVSGTRSMIERIPCRRGDDGLYRDIEGFLVENYGFPLNRRLYGCIKVICGDFEEAAKFAARDIGLYHEG